jgi:hypothetical protein
MKVVKKANVVDFFIDDLPVLHFEDDGETYGKLQARRKRPSISF